MTIAERVKDQWRTIDGGGQLLKRVAFSGGATALRFAVNPAVGGPGAYYQTMSTGFEAGMPSVEIRDGMEIYREYHGGIGEITDKAKMGEPITVVIRMRSLNGREITNVSIVDLLPGGFEVAKSSIEPGQHTAGCDYVDMREDRILYYTTVTPAVKDITYQLKPVNCGEFTVPPIFAESMYDRGIKARGLGGSLRVTNSQ
jgi:uncharacterized protein YfaS (alpha-2-macroglobulin family)